ncbi:MAG: helix-turn-helix domain-containing protein [Lachnospiraceae bacterium]|nr:helix-turn-helix domain-containing protein [Lachnospiraceae bacterium]
MRFTQKLLHRTKAVYMYQKDRSNKEGQCYPAISTVAKELQLSRRTVKYKKQWNNDTNTRSVPECIL